MDTNYLSLQIVEPLPHQVGLVADKLRLLLLLVAMGHHDDMMGSETSNCVGRAWARWEVKGQTSLSHLCKYLCVINHSVTMEITQLVC